MFIAVLLEENAPCHTHRAQTIALRTPTAHDFGAWFHVDTVVEELCLEYTTVLMWTALCLVIGIAGGITGLVIIDKQTRRGIALVVVSLLLLILGLTLDPVGTLRGLARDDRPFDDHGRPNYWANLNTGELIHKTDTEVSACRGERVSVLDTAWGPYQTCNLFGDGQLVEAAGAVRQIAEAIKAYSGNRNAIVVKPGATFTIDRSWFTFPSNGSRCVQVYAVLQGGKALMDSHGLLYQRDGGEWLLADSNGPSGKGVFYPVRQLNVQTPDELPRVMFLKVGVIETVGQPRIAPPSFCF